MSRAIDIIENHQPEPLSSSAAKQIQNIVEEAEKEMNLSQRPPA
jgi:hypothetical protein